MSAPSSPAVAFTSLTAEEKVRYLTEQLTQREETLNTMKVKTKEYVTKMKSDAQQAQEQAIQLLREEYEQKLKDLRQEMNDKVVKSETLVENGAFSTLSKDSEVMVSTTHVSNTP